MSNASWEFLAASRIVAATAAEECCVLRRALREATDAFLATLDRYTLADLMAPRQALSMVLQLNVADGGVKPGLRTA
jgi:Rrf2 family nitric oxide-sensitive transcriptional repressor